MAKRRADKQMTHDNWDDEEPVEEVGVFECASEDVLAKRPIRKAKRTLPPQSDDSTPRPNPFAGFSFNRNGSSGSTMSTTAVNSNGTGTNTRTSDEYLLKVAQLNRDILKFITRLMDTGPYLNLTPCFDDYIKHFQRLTTEEEERQRKNNNNNNISTTTMASSVISSGGFGSSGAGLASGKATESEPKATFCFGSNATPKSSTDLKSTGTSSTSLFGATASSGGGNSLNSSTQDAGAPAKFTFGAPPATNQAASSSSSSTGPAGNTLFGTISPTSTGTAPSAVNVEKKTDSAVTFKFGATPSAATTDKSGTAADTPAKPLFSFNSTTGFSFGAAAALVSGKSNSAGFTHTATRDANEEEEDEAPPKVDIAPVEEEGSLYTKKVKLFYKKQESDEKGQYADKGVGFLHIKKLEGGGYQLLVRAQTTLGNVLLNVRLGKDMPVKNVGKNNVAIICVPNPRLDPKSKEDKPDPPTMFLIRVKTSEDAVELRDKLIEYKDSI